jgi:hypothetical protein
MLWEILSWTCTALGIAGAWLIAKKRIEGFYCWVPGNTGWIVYFCWHEQWAAAGLFTAYLYTAFLGIWHWKKNADAIHEAKIKVLREAIVEIDKWDPDGFSQQEAVKTVGRMVVKLRDGFEIARIERIE